MIHRPHWDVEALITRLCQFAGGAAYASTTAEAKE